MDSEATSRVGPEEVRIIGSLEAGSCIRCKVGIYRIEAGAVGVSFNNHRGKKGNFYTMKARDVGRLIQRRTEPDGSFGYLFWDFVDHAAMPGRSGDLKEAAEGE